MLGWPYQYLTCAPCCPEGVESQSIDYTTQIYFRYLDGRLRNMQFVKSVQWGFRRLALACPIVINTSLKPLVMIVATPDKLESLTRIRLTFRIIHAVMVSWVILEYSIRNLTTQVRLLDFSQPCLTQLTQFCTSKLQYKYSTVVSIVTSIVEIY